ncbi:MAG: hypothetical protein LBC44_00505 [Mycoplasmataceae bacterium]|jgi:hypothetical protein|nr:hypothetical protein [Mycoplasmataceae bacterium]
MVKTTSWVEIVWKNPLTEEIKDLTNYVRENGERILKERQHDDDFEHGRGGKEF